MALRCSGAMLPAFSERTCTLMEGLARWTLLASYIVAVGPRQGRRDLSWRSSHTWLQVRVRGLPVSAVSTPP
eukprot:12925986-Prorocentrum_lima.AAC.1